jgi:hypothetical protein
MGVTYVTYSWNSQCAERNLNRPRLFFPKKDQMVSEDSIADRVITAQKPYLVEKVCLDDEGSDLLTAIVQPIVLGATVSKVALAALHYEDRELLRPQVEWLRPLAIESLSHL